MAEYWDGHDIRVFEYVIGAAHFKTLSSPCPGAAQHCPGSIAADPLPPVPTFPESACVLRAFRAGNRDPLSLKAL